MNEDILPSYCVREIVCLQHGPRLMPTPCSMVSRRKSTWRTMIPYWSQKGESVNPTGKFTQRVQELTWQMASVSRPARTTQNLRSGLILKMIHLVSNYFLRHQNQSSHPRVPAPSPMFMMKLISNCDSNLCMPEPCHRQQCHYFSA
jgi:hypothetical protein